MKRLIYIIGILLMVSLASGLEYFVSDLQNSISHLVSDEVIHNEFLPFGEPLQLSSVYGFTGKELDASNLFHFNARQMASFDGRFVTPDTIKPTLINPQSLNLFAYTLNNPIKFNDPTGNNEGKVFKKAMQLAFDFKASRKKGLILPAEDIEILDKMPARIDPWAREKEIARKALADDVEFESFSFLKLAENRKAPERFGKVYDDINDEYYALHGMHDIDPERIVQPGFLIKENNAVVGFNMEKIKGTQMWPYALEHRHISDSFLDQIDDAVSVMHKHGYAHGDLHGYNIYFLPDGGIKIADPVGYPRNFEYFEMAKTDDWDTLARTKLLWTQWLTNN